MKKLSLIILFGVLLFSFFGCATTHRVAYPPSSDLFVTMGDDPGSESQKSYIPKGTFIHVSTEYYLPLPIFGLITFGNAEPNYVFTKKVLPQVKEMGGDALTNAYLSYTPPPGFITRFFGVLLFFTPPSQIIVTGQVVKR